MNEVGLSGAIARSSKAKPLVDFVLKQVRTPLPHNKASIDMVDLLLELGVTFSRAAAAPRLEKNCAGSKTRTCSLSAHRAAGRSTCNSTRRQESLFSSLTMALMAPPPALSTSV